MAPLNFFTRAIADIGLRAARFGSSYARPPSLFLADRLATPPSVMQRIYRVAGWFLLAAIVVLSSVPATSRPVTGTPHSLEHLAIFLPTGLVFALGYPSRHALQLLGLIAFAVTVELGQLWVPGRHARFSDFLINALGLGVGVGLGYLVRRTSTLTPQ